MSAGLFVQCSLERGCWEHALWNTSSFRLAVQQLWLLLCCRLAAASPEPGFVHSCTGAGLVHFAMEPWTTAFVWDDDGWIELCTAQVPLLNGARKGCCWLS
jgi:hypothetical protein